MASVRTIDLMQTLENVNVPSVVIDRHGTLTWMNAAAKTAFGELVGRDVATVVAPEDVPLVKKQVERKLRGARVTDYEIDVLTPDGRRRVEVSSVPTAGGDECHAIFGLVVPRGRRAQPSRVRLTPRQHEVLRLLGEGASTEEVAATLHLSKETVRNHVRHVLRALGAHSRLEAVARAHELGLLPSA